VVVPVASSCRQIVLLRRRVYRAGHGKSIPDTPRLRGGEVLRDTLPLEQRKADLHARQKSHASGRPRTTGRDQPLVAQQRLRRLRLPGNTQTGQLVQRRGWADELRASSAV